jgi:hypothetical protein
MPRAKATGNLIDLRFGIDISHVTQLSRIRITDHDESAYSSQYINSLHRRLAFMSDAECSVSLMQRLPVGLAACRTHAG